MSLTGIAVHFAMPLPKIEEYERVLFIGPHPDDIEIGAGATAAKLAHMGKQVTFLICADGRFGDGFMPEGTTSEELVAIRKKEAIASAALLGVEDVRFLGLIDGGFYEEKELEDGIARVIGEVNPDLIFAPDPDTRSECHTDHLNVGNAAKRMACFAPYHGIMERRGAKAAKTAALALYMTARPNVYVRTGRPLLHLQIKSIFGVHRSQFPKGSSERSSTELYLKLRALEFGLKSRKGLAEGFRVMTQGRMHCLPEADRF